MKSAKIRKFARGRDCTIRLPGFCNRDSDTTVMAHPPIANGGMGSKASDLECAICCWGCHMAIDQHIAKRIDVFECWIRGSAETRAQLVEAGIVEVK